VFERIKYNSAHTSETTPPPLSIRTDPQRILLMMKSPTVMNGGGNSDNRMVRLSMARSIAGGA
jgi:hypothetical protein